MTARKIVSVFDTQEAAQSACDSLMDLGLDRADVSIVDQSTSEQSVRSQTHQGSFWAHVKQMFMPHADRVTYEESLRRGGYLLTANVDDERADEAIARLESAGAIDLDERETQWRSAGWNGGAVEQSSAAELKRSASSEDREAGGETIPVVEERLLVGKREVNRGGVRVRSYLVEEPVQEQVRLREERVDIERVPVDEPLRSVAPGSPDDLMQERTVEVTETAEEPVVSKDARIKEEVRVRKSANERVETVDDTIRKTEVEVDDTRSGVKRRGTTGSERPRTGK